MRDTQSLYIKMDGAEYKYSSPRGGYLLYLVTSEQMQEFDKFTIHTLQVPGIVLMDHAGKAVAQEVAQRNPSTVVVVCGKGNNGGDGWVTARWLNNWGIQVQVVSVVNPQELQGEARLAAEMALAVAVPYEVYQMGAPLPNADVYVDAILGTGTTRPLAEELVQLVRDVNHVSAFTLAVDIPTGVNASTGEVLGVAIEAAQTICLGAQKLGTAVTPGAYFAGMVTVADIGIPVAVAAKNADSMTTWVTPDDVRRWLPKRTSDAHKGTYGKVGIVAGQMRGAAILAGLGAARSGAGLVVLGEDPLGGGEAPYEFVVRRRSDAADPLLPFADCRAIVVGPGLGDVAIDLQRPDSAWQQALRNARQGGVLDADGLLGLLTDSNLLQHGRWVLTPHPKECGRLLGWSTEEVQAKRLTAAEQLARATGAVVVLKGYRSIIAAPDGRQCVNPTGDASLATAGTGDVLAGVVGGLLAQGLEPFAAAAAGAYLHGVAGELTGRAHGQAGVLASDVISHIPHAIRQLMHSLPGG